MDDIWCIQRVSDMYKSRCYECKCILDDEDYFGKHESRGEFVMLGYQCSECGHEEFV